MKELGIFADESGGQDGHSKYYALTLVFHDQAKDIDGELLKYRNGLELRGLDDIPFHANPNINGHGPYQNLDFSTRKLYLHQFLLLLQHLPITYHSFVYQRSEVGGRDEFVSRMQRDVEAFLLEHLGFFQSFDVVKLYYDNGQAIVTSALHAALENALSGGCLLYRTVDASAFALAQAADMLCTEEATARKFQAHGPTRTDEKMFGNAGSFRKNYLKPLRRKRFGR